jgi:hypothetical protein
VAALYRTVGLLYPQPHERQYGIDELRSRPAPSNAGPGQSSGMATYPANLCPIHCGGAASHSRRRTTILHSEGGDCKRFL